MKAKGVSDGCHYGWVSASLGEKKMMTGESGGSWVWMGSVVGQNDKFHQYDSVMESL